MLISLSYEVFMNHSILFLGLTALLLSCSGEKKEGPSKSSGSFQFNLSDIEESRAKNLMGKESDDLGIEKQIPLMTGPGIRTLLINIAKDLLKGREFRDIEAQLWFALDSLHLFEATGAKKAFYNDLDDIASLDDDAAEVIKLYMESEGMEELPQFAEEEIFDLESETDINKKSILSRRNTRIYKSHLLTPQGLHLLIPHSFQKKEIIRASEEIIQEALKSSVGQPVHYHFPDTSFELPRLVWKGSLSTHWGGVTTVNSDYISGMRLGGKHDWANSYGQSSSHTFLTPNAVTLVSEEASTYQFSLGVQVKGGGKKKANGGFSNKTVGLSYSLAGDMILPGCDNLAICSPFVIFKLEKSQRMNGSSVSVKINGSEVEEFGSILLDRTKGETNISVSISGSHSHRGKSGAINQDIQLKFKIIQFDKNAKGPIFLQNLKSEHDFLTLHDWRKMFEEKDFRREKNIFNYLVYLDKSIKHDMSVSQLSAARVLNNYIISVASRYYAPIVRNLIEEKKKNIKRFPIQELLNALNEQAKLRTLERMNENNQKTVVSLLRDLDKKDQEKLGIDLALLSQVREQRQLVTSLYLYLHQSFGHIMNDWEKEIKELEVELAQLEHLVKEDQDSRAEYEIH